MTAVRPPTVSHHGRRTHPLTLTTSRRLLVLFLAIVILIYLRLASLVITTHHDEQRQRCAINFFGLPRAFENIVLPSLIKNVIIPNAKHNCDYFVHYYQLDHEVGGRSGLGGAIHPEKVRLLEREVLKYHPNNLPRPIIKFIVGQEEDFWNEYQPLLDKIHSTKDEKGNPLYFPFKAQTYKKQTVDNLIKMWHSVQQVWYAMEEYAKQEGFQYTQVAMLRSDVLYMTPIPLYEYPHQVVVPGFGRYPVSDRIVYGPADAVKVWATGRFERVEEHVQFMKKKKYGWGLHSERFMHFAIFPAMRKALSSNDERGDDAIVEHPTLCFFRARADETVWVSDCDGNAKKSVLENLLQGDSISKPQAVGKVLGRTCHGTPTRVKYTVWSLDCHKGNRTVADE